MSGIWYTAFALVGLLSATTAVLLIATMRQVGVLHQRVRPTGAGQHEGPAIGSRVPKIHFDPVRGVERMPFERRITLLGYVTPGCGLCEDLAKHIGAYRRTQPEHVDAFLATEMTVERAQQWVAEHKVHAPVLQAPDAMHRHQIPGSPYVLALHSDGRAETARVLATGVVNTLEQLEDLMVQADDNARALVREDDAAAFFGDAPNDDAVPLITHVTPAPPPSLEQVNGKQEA